MSGDDDARVTFRAPKERIDELDMLIIQRKADGTIPPDVSRSDLLREAVEDLIDDLEDEEGNLNRGTPKVATAD